MKKYKTEQAAQKAADKLSKEDPTGMYLVRKEGKFWIIMFLGGLFSLLLYICYL